MKHFALVLLSALCACGTKYTAEQAKAVVKSCVEKRFCDGRSVELQSLDVTKQDDVVSGLRRIPTTWEMTGTVKFKDESSARSEKCDEKFVANVTRTDNQAPNQDSSEDSIAKVQIDPTPMSKGVQGQRKLCWYFLASGRVAEK